MVTRSRLRWIVNAPLFIEMKMVTHSCGTIKIAVTGASGVGKSAIITSYVQDTFDPFLKSSIGIDFLCKQIQVDEEKLLVQLWESEVDLINALIIVYDVTCRQSFNFALKALTDKSHHCIPIMLLGNKSDLESKRQISRTEGEVTALRYAVMFQEVSCTRVGDLKEKLLDFIASLACI